MPAKVLQILEATTGGTRRHLMDVVMGLNRGIFNVTVLCSTLRNNAFIEDVAKMRNKGIKVEIVEMKRSISPLSDLSAFFKIRSFIKKGNFQIVHTHSSKAGFLGRLAARSADVPCLLHTPHGFPFEMDVPNMARRFYRSLERYAARFTDCMICVCPHEKSVALHELQIPKHSIAVIENGIEPERIATSPGDSHLLRVELGIGRDAVIVGAIGRFTQQKGHADLIRAARAVVDEMPETQFLIVGDGELGQYLKAMIDRLTLGGNVRVLEAREGVGVLYSLFDILVLPSHWEGLPYVLLEAMAAAKPIVATDVGGIPDVITDMESGMLVPVGNKKALADAITMLAGDSELQERLGKCARERIEKSYRLSNMIESLESLYATSLNSTRSTG